MEKAQHKCMYFKDTFSEEKPSCVVTMPLTSFLCPWSCPRRSWCSDPSENLCPCPFEEEDDQAQLVLQNHALIEAHLVQQDVENHLFEELSPCVCSPSACLSSSRHLGHFMVSDRVPSALPETYAVEGCPPTMACVPRSPRR